VGPSALNDAVTNLVTRADVIETIGRLKSELRASSEPFVWATIGLQNVANIPAEIRSAWIFALRAERWSGEHYHPNSVQHMMVIEGHGRSRVGGAIGEMSAFGDDSPGDQWFVIDPGVRHEFYPVKNDMIVISFHTATAQELLEVSESGGSIRHYE
jgi:mannose-6-phosphate isomerase-like protein (cupin superfamily)